MFSQKVYSVTYNDSTPPGQVIPSICTDQDIGVGALQGVVFLNTTPGVFSLNPSTGVLTTNISMDYRRARGYTVVLLCNDTGGLTNTSTVYVTITPPLIFSNAIPSPLLPTSTTQAQQTMIYIVVGIIAAAVLVVGVPILIMLILIWRRAKTHKAPGAATSIPVHTSAHR